MSIAIQQTAPRSSADEPRVKIVSHSDLVYWWPVWAAGFLMAFLTYQGGHRMAIVPDGTVAEQGRRVEGHEGPRDVLVVPPGKGLFVDRETGTLAQPRLRMAVSNSLGAVFATVLLLVILITNVRLRGVWTLVVLVGSRKAVALAAKHARIAWALLAKCLEYRQARPEVAAA